MRRPNHTEGEIKGDLPHPSSAGLCSRRNLVARGLKGGAGSQNVYEGDKPLNSFLSHCTLGSVQRDETASRGPASTWEGIAFGMSLQGTMLEKRGHLLLA